VGPKACVSRFPRFFRLSFWQDRFRKTAYTDYNDRANISCPDSGLDEYGYYSNIDEDVTCVESLCDQYRGYCRHYPIVGCTTTPCITELTCPDDDNDCTITECIDGFCHDTPTSESDVLCDQDDVPFCVLRQCEPYTGVCTDYTYNPCPEVDCYYEEEDFCEGLLDKDVYPCWDARCTEGLLLYQF